MIHCPAVQARRSPVARRLPGLVLALTLLAATGWCGPAAAQTMVAGLDWRDLSSQERAALGPLERRWSELDDQRQQKWRDIARRLDDLPPGERKRIQERMSRWAEMSPQQRGEARLGFVEAQRWSSDARRERWSEYQSLDPEARKVLAERWRLEEAARQSRQPEQGKRNLIAPPEEQVRPREPASPTSVRARAGATSKLIQAEGRTRDHELGRVPKIATTEDFVDPVTLLPRRGPQGAAITPVGKRRGSR